MNTKPTRWYRYDPAGHETHPLYWWSFALLIVAAIALTRLILF